MSDGYRDEILGALRSDHEKVIITGEQQPPLQTSNFTPGCRISSEAPQSEAPYAAAGNHNGVEPPPVMAAKTGGDTPKCGPQETHIVDQRQEQALAFEDHMQKMRHETELIRAHNSNIAAQKQAMRNQQEQWDAHRINQLRNDLSFKKIISLDTSRTVMAPFPFEVFPREALELIETMSSGSVARKEVIGVGLLGAVSAATQGNWFISDSSAFTQPLTFYTIIAAPSGFGKSTACDVLVAPFKEHDRKFSLLNSATACPMAVSAAKAAYKATVKKSIIKDGYTIQAAIASSRGLAEELRELESSQSSDCNVSRLLYRTTMEHLPFEMARRKGAAAIIDPEGGLLTMISGKKNDIILKGFDGESFESLTRTSGRVRIDHAFLSITSFVQPSKLITFCGKTEAADHGVHPRFCMMIAKPEDLRKDVPLPIISSRLTNWYNGLVSCLLSSERTADIEPQNEIHLNRAAEQRLLSGIRGLLQNREKSDGLLGPFESRLQQHTKNIAGLLLLMHRGRYFLPEGDGAAFELDEGLMSDALKIMRFFHAHAQVILSPEFAEGLNFAQKILRWIKHENRTSFSEREAQRGIGHCKVAQIRMGLAELERCHYVSRFVNSKSRSTYVVHPFAALRAIK